VSGRWGGTHKTTWEENEDWWRGDERRFYTARRAPNDVVGILRGGGALVHVKCGTQDPYVFPKWHWWDHPMHACIMF